MTLRKFIGALLLSAVVGEIAGAAMPRHVNQQPALASQQRAAQHKEAQR